MHTGQHYDRNMSDVFFQGLKLPSPEFNLEIGSGKHGEMTGKMLGAIEEVLIHSRPDFVVVYGDTNSTVAAALATAKLGIPVGHVEAGLRSHNRAMPEELNRVVTDHISNFLFAPTELAMENLQFEGLGELATLTGDVMADLIYQYAPLLEKPKTAIIDAVGDHFVVATIHRASNTDAPNQLRRLVNALHSLEQHVFLVAHPRLAAAAEKYGIMLNNHNTSLIQPLPYLEMLGLVRYSAGLITDSGGLQKEAYLLGVPCVTLRAETEWTKTLDNGMNVLCPSGDGLQMLVNRDVSVQVSAVFGEGDAAKKVARCIVNSLST